MREQAKMPKTQVHTRYYLKDGELAVGVTTALSILAKPALIKWANNLGLQGLDSNKVRDQAGERGTITHLLITSELKNETPDLSEYSQSDIDVATLCLNSFHEWRKTHILEPIYIETPIVSEQYRYGGTPDYFGLVNGELQLIDFKSSNQISNDYFYQVAAYRQLTLENWCTELKRARILRFSKEDNVEFEDRLITQFSKEFELFIHCLAIYNLLKQMKRNL
jgi:hypothetical protein